MNFAVLENGVVTRICGGDKTPLLGRTDILDLPDDTDVTVGTRRGEIDNYGYKKPVRDLVEAGFLAIDDYHVLDGDQVRRKTDDELIVDGLLPVPFSMKVHKGKIVPMTDVEMVEAGLRTLMLNETIIDGSVVTIPDGFKEHDGKIVEMTDAEKVAANLLIVEKGYILDGDSIRKMTQAERYMAYIDPIPYNVRVVGGEVVTYTDDELDELAWAEDKDGWIQNACEAVNKSLAYTLKNGFTYNGIVYQADDVSQQRAGAVVLSASSGSLPAPISWRSTDNTYHTFNTIDDFKEFYSAMVQFYQLKIMSAWEISDSVKSAKTCSEAKAALMLVV